MGKYLKMPAGFDGGAEWFGNAMKDDMTASDVLIDAAVHAINSHDELVAEVERLRLIATKLYHDGVNFIGAEDLDDEEDAAEMQGRFNDTLIEASAILGV
ncbi:MAG: hypothetical protein ACRDC4_07560 [Plesiomonas sp.]